MEFWKKGALGGHVLIDNKKYWACTSLHVLLETHHLVQITCMFRACLPLNSLQTTSHSSVNFCKFCHTLPVRKHKQQEHILTLVLDYFHQQKLFSSVLLMTHSRIPTLGTPLTYSFSSTFYALTFRGCLLLGSENCLQRKGSNKQHNTT